LRDIPLLVVSCDRYSDLWDPFFGIFWRRWPDCPFQVNLVANIMKYSHPRVTTVTIGEDIGWGAGLIEALSQLSSEYVIIFLEDFFLEKLVDTAEVLRLTEIAVENRVGCLRLTPNPRPSLKVVGHQNLGWILPGDPYRVSTQVALWRIDTLVSVVKPVFSPWDFELKGSLLSTNLIEPFWSVWKPVIHCQHAVERGLWIPWGLSTCDAAGIKVDLTKRRAMTKREICRRKLAELRGRVFLSLPRPLQRKRWLKIASGQQ